eukprot:6480064-Amphidinium_carterae.1
MLRGLVTTDPGVVRKSWKMSDKDFEAEFLVSLDGCNCIIADLKAATERLLKMQQAKVDA